jgi:hypothetical protein
MACEETPICSPCNPDYSDTGCPQYIKDTCVTITEDINCLSITKNETLAEALQHMKDVICALTPTAYADFDYSCFASQGITTEQEFVEFIAATLCEVLGTQVPGDITSLSDLYALIQNLTTEVNLIKNQAVVTCFRGLTGLNNPEPIGVLLTAIQNVICDHEDRIVAIESTSTTPLVATDSATIDFTTSGTLDHALTGSVKLSATANNAITANVDGIHALSPAITVVDSDEINLTVSGTHNHTLRANISLSALDGDNILTIESDGLYAKQRQINPTDSTSIDFTLTDAVNNDFTAVVKLDPNPTNIISITGSGLFASASGFSLANNSVSNIVLRDSVAYSVIGRTSNSTGDPADITAAVDQVLRRSGGGNLEFGTLVTNNIGDQQITFPKIQNITTGRLLGRTTAGTGVIEEISVGSNLSFSGGILNLGAVPISYLSAATAANTIDNGTYAQTWTWNSLSGANGLKLSSTSTIGLSQSLLDVRLSGAFSNANATGTTAYFETTKTGTTSTNNALVAFASGATTNYGIVCSGAGGQWGTAAGASIYAQGRMRIDGQIDTYGSTSGIVTVKPAAIAGTWTLTLPDNAGIASDVLITDGSGTTSWKTLIPVNSGFYTPTLTNTTNLTASTAYQCYWYRVGDMVTVFGKVDVDPTAAGNTVLNMELPVASGLTGDSDLAGTAACSTISGEVISISPGGADLAKFRWTATDTTNHSLHFHLSYYIVPA